MKSRILTFTDCTDVASNELHATLNRTINALGPRRQSSNRPVRQLQRILDHQLRLSGSPTSRKLRSVKHCLTDCS